jgi:hypothetical protein
MRVRGFPYSPPSFVDAGGIFGDDERAPLGDVDQARAHGYGLADSIHPRLKATVRRRGHLLPRGARWRRAFADALVGPAGSTPYRASANRSPTGGPVSPHAAGPSCYDRARHAVYGDEQDDIRATYLALRQDLDRRLAADPAHMAAIRDWQACMQQRGYPYSAPNSAADALGRLYADAHLRATQLRSAERGAASADATCVNEVGFLQREHAAMERIQPALDAEARDTLIALKDREDAAAARAERVLAASTHASPATTRPAPMAAVPPGPRTQAPTITNLYGRSTDRVQRAALCGHIACR